MPSMACFSLSSAFFFASSTAVEITSISEAVLPTPCIVLVAKSMACWTAFVSLSLASHANFHDLAAAARAPSTSRTLCFSDRTCLATSLTSSRLTPATSLDASRILAYLSARSCITSGSLNAGRSANLVGSSSSCEHGAAAPSAPSVSAAFPAGELSPASAPSAVLASSFAELSSFFFVSSSTDDSKEKKGPAEPDEESSSEPSDNDCCCLAVATSISFGSG
mmetsp:Transcript_120542/g.300710  ORF Transcript_120542/g.300710 Transcript_120542/m.300710 type:complete len:222 (-) Transcript_120542:908-1573(-)